MLASIKKKVLLKCVLRLEDLPYVPIREGLSIVLLFRSQPLSLSLSPSELLFLNKLCNIHF